MPTIPVRLKGLRASLASIAADLFQDRFGWLTDISRVVWYYTASSYAILARRDVLETFEAGIQDATVTAGQAMVAGASGRYQTQDAATFRATIDAAASAHDHSHMATGLTFETGDPFLVRESHDLRGGVRTMNGAGPFGVGYYCVVDVRHRNGDADGADAYGGMIAWEMLSGYPRIAIRSRTSTDWTTWIELSRIGHDHASITVDGTTRISAGGAATLASLQASNLSGPGARPLVAGPDGDIDDQDAATFRATIDAVNRAGDSVEANFTLAAPNTNQPPLLLNKGVSGALGWIGFRNPDLGSNQKNWLVGGVSGGAFAIGTTWDNWALGLVETFKLSRDGFITLGGFIGGGTLPLVKDSTGKILAQAVETFKGTIGIPATVTREMQIQALPITNAAPDVVTLGPSGNMKSFGFDGNTQAEELFYHIDTNHDYVAETSIVPHAHWTQSSNGTGTVRFKFDIQWVMGGGAIPAPTTYACTDVNVNGTAWSEEQRSEATVPGTGKTYNSRIILRLYRDPSEDTFTGDAVLTSIGVHYTANPLQAG